jgi:hypothetical protein
MFTTRPKKTIKNKVGNLLPVLYKRLMDSSRAFEQFVAKSPIIGVIGLAHE